MTPTEHDRRIDYIEMNVADIERSKAFYGQAFTWTFKDYGPDYCEFRDGRLTGGFTTHGRPSPGGPLIVLYADDLVAMQARVETAGARSPRQSLIFPEDSAFTSSTRTVTSWRSGRRRRRRHAGTSWTQRDRSRSGVSTHESSHRVRKGIAKRLSPNRVAAVPS